jgi:hypothetical protein
MSFTTLICTKAKNDNILNRLLTNVNMNLSYMTFIFHLYYLLEFLDPQIVDVHIVLIYLQVFTNHNDIALSSTFQWNPN